MLTELTQISPFKREFNKPKLNNVSIWEYFYYKSQKLKVVSWTKKIFIACEQPYKYIAYIIIYNSKKRYVIAENIEIGEVNTFDEIELKLIHQTDVFLYNLEMKNVTKD